MSNLSLDYSEDESKEEDKKKVEEQITSLLPPNIQ
jgi:hypothetical protein